MDLDIIFLVLLEILIIINTRMTMSYCIIKCIHISIKCVILMGMVCIMGIV